jgi:hypothetical protein
MERPRIVPNGSQKVGATVGKWRGDRIEWMLARGFHAWFFNEIEEDRVAWPGPHYPRQ